MLLIELEWPWAQMTALTPTSTGFPDSAPQCPRPAKLRMATPSVDTASLEDSLIDWLEEKGFAEAWKLAPMLAEANIQLSSLQET